MVNSDFGDWFSFPDTYMETTKEKTPSIVLRRNVYVNHPKNLLLSIVNDERREIRILGWSRILKARDQTKETRQNICIFQASEDLNFGAADHVDFFDWKKWTPTEPPLTIHLARKLIVQNKQLATKPENTQIYPWHEQAAE